MREEIDVRSNKKQYLQYAPKIVMFTIFSLLLLASISVSSLATMDVMLSDQGTGVKDKTTQQIMTLGNITIDVYDSLTGGNLIYSETFTNAIKNGSWNVMLGETTPLPLEFGKAYYSDYNINGEDASFKDGTGATVGRQIFYAPLGDINGSKLIDGTLTKVKIETCANGQIMKMSGGAWTCTNEAAFTDTNCSIDGSCPAIVYNSDQSTLNVNSSTWWSSLSGWMAGWFYKSGSSIAFNESKLNSTIDARTSMLGDNASWNEGYADTKYLQTGDQRYNDTSTINSVNTNANARMDTLNSTKAATGNCPAGYAMQNTTATGVQCISIPSLSEVDPIFTSQNATIWSAINGKLGLSDQRYNDTTLINSLDTATNNRVDLLNSTKLDKIDQRYNDTAAINSVDTDTNSRIDNLNTTKLDKTDQRYNDTAAITAANSDTTTRIDTINSTKLDKTDQRYNDSAAINSLDTTANARIDTINSTKLDKTDQRYNDTAAINSVDTNTNARIDLLNTTKLDKTDQRYNDTAVISSIGNWTADKPSYTATNGLVAILGNWSADKSSYATSSTMSALDTKVNSIGNWTADKPSYATTASVTALDTKLGTVGNWTADKANYVTNTIFSSIGNWSLDKAGYTPTTGLATILGNWSLDKPNYATAAALSSVGNWTQDKAAYATVAGNINTSNIVASVGNWTADKASYATVSGNINTSNIVTSVGNWSADKASYATDAKVNSIGNWTEDKPSYALDSRVTSVNATANSIGNWTADKPSYATTAAVTTLDTKVNSIGNWTEDKGSYAFDSRVTAVNNTANSLGNWSADKTNYALDSRVTSVNTTSNIQNLGFVTGEHRKGDGVYLYNNTDTMYLNETKLNQTIDARDSDTTYNFQCPTGQFVKNLTSTGGYVCEAAAGSGDITSVQADNKYVYNGSDTGDVILAFNETKLNATIDTRAAAFGDNKTWNESYANTKYLQISDQRYNDSAAISSIGNWTLDKPGYTLTSGLVSILGNWSLDKSGYTVTSGLVSILGNWSLDKPSYATVANNINTSNIVASVGNWSLDKPTYTATSGLVGILGNWSLDKPNYATISGNINTSNIVASVGNWTLDQPSYITAASVDTGYYNKTVSDAKYAIGTAYESTNYTTIDITSSVNTTYNTTAFLFLTLQPSRTYAIECEIINDAAAATTGVQLRINTTGSPTSVTTVYQSMGSATAIETFSGTNTASNALLDAGSSNTTYGIGTVRSRIVTGASTSLWTIEMKTEVNANQARVRAGSYCKSLRLA